MQRKRASVNCVCRCAARTGRDIVLPDARGDPRFNPKLDQDMACAMTISLMCLSVCLSVCLCLCSSLSLLTSVSERFARGLCVSLVRARSLSRSLARSLFECALPRATSLPPRNTCKKTFPPCFFPRHAVAGAVQTLLLPALH